MRIPARHAKVPVLLAAAAFFWSAWTAAPLRFALLSLRPAPPAATVKPPEGPREKVASVARLDQALRDPKAISNRDVRDARNSWGDEAARLLSLIR